MGGVLWCCDLYLLAELNAVSVWQKSENVVKVNVFCAPPNFVLQNPPGGEKFYLTNIYGEECSLNHDFSFVYPKNIRLKICEIR